MTRPEIVPNTHSDQEVWRACVSFPGYEVSSHGGVRSLDRVLTRTLRSGRVINQPLRGRPLKTCLIGAGYLMVSIAGRPRYVHILVLEAFICPRPTGLLGLHGDDDPLNCHIANLRWGTQRDNVRDARRNGRRIGRPPGSTDRRPRSRRAS